MALAILNTSTNGSLRREAEPMLAPFGLALAAFTAFILAVAWGFEIIGGYEPCKLCLQQREGYYTAIPLLLVAALAAARRWPSFAVRGLFLVAGLLMATSVTTGVYQSGAEWGWWPGPNDCGATELPTVTGGSLLDEINTTRVIFCDEASWRFLGLSFAGWNVVTASVITLASIAAAFSRVSRSETGH